MQQTSDRQRILVIEDHELVALNLKMHLEAKGHEVRTVATGEEGLQVADQFQPSLVLCDLSLPGIDGYTVTRLLRRRPSLQQTRFIAMTGWSFPTDVAELRQAGFDHGLFKPFTPQDLFRAVNPPTTPPTNSAVNTSPELITNSATNSSPEPMASDEGREQARRGQEGRHFTPLSTASGAPTTGTLLPSPPLRRSAPGHRDGGEGVSHGRENQSSEDAIEEEEAKRDAPVGPCSPIRPSANGRAYESPQC